MRKHNLYASERRQARYGGKSPGKSLATESLEVRGDTCSKYNSSGVGRGGPLSPPCILRAPIWGVDTRGWLGMYQRHSNGERRGITMSEGAEPGKLGLAQSRGSGATGAGPARDERADGFALTFRPLPSSDMICRIRSLGMISPRQN